MQNPLDTDLAASINDTSRIIVSLIEVDWNRNLLYNHAYTDLSKIAVSINVERDLTGNLPEETTMVEGYSAAKLTVVLAGRRTDDELDAAQLFSPFRTDSPLYSLPKEGMTIRWSLTTRKHSGIDGGWMQQFFGQIVEVNIDSASRTVTITALDNVEKCRTPITLPVQAMQSWYDQNPTQFSPFYWRHNTQWVIDHALRKSGFFMSPVYQSTCIYSATCHGSPVPEIGYALQPMEMQGARPDPGEWYTPGQWGLAMNGTPKFESIWHSRAFAQFTPVNGDPNEWSIQLMAKFGANQAAHSGSGGDLLVLSTGDGPYQGTAMVINLNYVTGQVLLEFWDNGAWEGDLVGGPTFAAYGWHHIAVKVKFTNIAATEVTFKGLSTQTIDLSNLTSPPITDEVTASVQTRFPVPIQCIQIDRGPVTTWYDPATWVGNSNLDSGLNHYISLPQVQNTPAWDVIQEATSSEYGCVGFDEFGVAYFRNRNTIKAGALTVEKAISADTTLLDLQVRMQLESVRNVIKVTTAGRWETSVDTIWEITRLDEQPFLTSGVHQLRVKLDRPARVQGGDLTAYLTAAWNDQNPHSGFVAMNPWTNSEVSGSVGVNVLLLPGDGYEFLLTINNTALEPIVFRTTSGSPSLKVGGFLIEDMDDVTTVYRRQSSITKYGEKPLDLGNNRFAQDPTMMEQVALSILKDLKSPVPVIERIQVVGDPRLQLTDTAELQDPSGLGASILCHVVGISRQYTDDGKLTDTISPRPIGPPGAWILGHPTRSILNQTTIPG